MAVIRPSTPPQTKQRSHTHTSTPQKLASERYKDMTWDICDKFIRPMPIAEFREEFVPEASQARVTERIISFDKCSVSHNEDHLIQAIKMSGLADNLTFVNTTVKQDKAIQGRPDIVIYRKREGHQENERLTSLDWRVVNVWIENKKGKEDIFRNLTYMRQEGRKGGLECHVRWTERTCIIGYDTTVTSVLKNNKGVGDAQSTLAVYMDVEKIEVEDLRQILVNDDHATDRTAEALYHMETNMGDENPFWSVDVWICIKKEGDIYHDSKEAKTCLEHAQTAAEYVQIDLGAMPGHLGCYDRLLFDNLEQLIRTHMTKQKFYIGISIRFIDQLGHVQEDGCDPAETTLLHDDIESFYWVLIYIVMKCRHSAIEGQSQDMQHVFDGYSDVDEDGVIWGGDRKLSFLHKLILHPDSFGFVPEPCCQIIEELRTLLKTFYDDINPKSIMPKPQEERNVQDRGQGCSREALFF
ncbi:hypothetical protein F5148DRAFT_1149590 [Russula earlei]|uniref:Uncharacterized protein n=1 Tax=Russula earlei TaxID=71964 RepID=A0ACC0U7X8_9AGAM|nr:hypothetical protein F5148DRAFT_1149590 [Russula earlei]